MPATNSVTSEQVKSCLYHYRAHVTAVYDGDTCTADIDLGLSTRVRGLILDKDVLLQTVKGTTGWSKPAPFRC